MLSQKKELLKRITESERKYRECLRVSEESISEFRKGHIARMWQRLTGWFRFGNIKAHRENWENLKRALLDARLLYNLDVYGEKVDDMFATAAGQLMYEEVQGLLKETGSRAELDVLTDRIKKEKEDQIVNGVYLKSISSASEKQMEGGELGFLQSEITLNNYIKDAKKRYEGKLTDEQMWKVIDEGHLTSLAIEKSENDTKAAAKALLG
ncbi:MAG: hypothetical protein NT030_08565, partial [Candidatus Saganbacteria bacterium]|nr:hypothetical protein [Candidatus Saganbacteria bacterium]